MNFRCLFILVSVFIILSCSSTNTIDVETNFDENGKIDSFQNLMFEFNSELAPQHLINMWDTTKYVKFTPAIEGSFKWISPKVLVFSPANGFTPNTSFKGSYTDDFKKLIASKGHELKEKEFKFHTEYIGFERVELIWNKSESSNKPVLAAAIRFTNNIVRENLNQYTKVLIDGKEYKFSFTFSDDPKSAQIIVFADEAKSIENQDIKITVDSRISAFNTSKESTIIEYNGKVPGLSELVINDILAEKEDMAGYALIIASQELDPKIDYSKFISISPKVVFTTEIENNQLSIKGNFDGNKPYKIQISKGFKSIFGFSLADDYSKSISFADVDAFIKFNYKNAYYLTSKGDKLVSVNIVNVPQIKVDIIKIYENNIMHFFRKGESYGGSYDGEESGDYDENEEYHDFMYYDTEDYGDVIFSKTYNTNDLETLNGAKLLKLDFSDKSKYDGIYVVAVRSVDKFWVQSSKIVSLSDLGLIVKKSKDDLIVFTNSILNAELVAGANIRLFGKSNQEVASEKTNDQGVAIFKNLSKLEPKVDIGMVAVNKGTDKNYLLLNNETKSQTEKFENIGGIDGSGYKAFIYGPRNLYRPDDTLVISGIVRTPEFKNLSNVPIKVSLVQPNSKVMKDFSVNLDEQGSFDLKYYIPANVLTGTYKVNVYLSNDLLLGSKFLSIEEFMPDRIKVQLSSDRGDYNIPSKMILKAQAMNLFGTPASNRNYEATVKLSKKEFSPKKYSKYDFVLKGIKEEFSPFELKGVTDKDGFAKAEVNLTNEYGNNGLLNADVSFTVFDETGRPVDRNMSINVFSQDKFIGIGRTDNWVSVKENVPIQLITLNKEGNPSSAEANIYLYKKEYQTSLVNDYGSYSYQSKYDYKLISSKNETIGENYIYNFKTNESGTYEIRVSLKGSSSYVYKTIYAYGQGYTTAGSFEVNKEGLIEIESDKAKYAPGDVAEILFKTPFQGKLFVTVERNGIYEHYITKTDKRAASVKIPIKDEYLPNVYVSATLIKPVDNGSMPLTVATGYLPLFVEKASTVIPVEIIADAKSRSNRTQKVTIKTRAEKDIFLTVAAVDEGILQITNYKSPNPHKFFYQQIAMGIESFNIYPFLHPELKMSSLSYGGDASGDLMVDPNRMNPLSNKRVKLLSYWSGILKTNSSGTASFEFEIPEFSGSVRIVAVAYKNNSFGSNEKTMTVSDPLVISAGIPRFLSPGDEFDSPVTLFNTTNKSMKTSIDIKTNSLLSIESISAKSIDIPANSEKVVWVKVKASQNIGNAEYKVMAVGNGENFKQSFDVTVRPAAGLVKESKSGVVTAGSYIDVDLQNNYLSGTEKKKVIISRSPIIEFMNDLTFLIQYPYGCSEQIISKAFPQLAFAEISKFIETNSTNEEMTNAKINVISAIEKIQSMQLPDGGVSTWLGGSESNWWNSIYAAHFLYESKKMGYAVSQRVRERLNSYMTEKLSNAPVTSTVKYDNNMKPVTVQSVPREVIYSLFVLALNGKPDFGMMNYYKSKLELLTSDAKYMLAATYKLAGDNNNFYSTLPNNFQSTSVRMYVNESYATPTRDLGISLYTLINADPTNRQIPEMTKMLSEALKREKRLSTQEAVFGLLALMKSAKEDSRNKCTGEIYQNSKKIADLKAADKTIQTKLNGGKVRIEAKGSGQLYYFVYSEGIPKSGVTANVDNYLKVRKRFLDRNGKEMFEFKQGDLIYVQISIEVVGGNTRIDNMVISDIIPAGFEIENPRLSDEKKPNWMIYFTKADHTDIRDDRINKFADIAGISNFYYAVRAVSKGKFKMGPVSADAMYSPDYYSYFGAGDIVIK